MRKTREFSRRPQRYLVKIPCQVVREKDFRLVADRIENLSTWGLLASPADPVLTGEKVIVSFQLPGSSHYVDATGTVTRVVHGRRPTETRRMLGIEFDDLSPYDRFRLRQAISQRPPFPPGPRAGRRRGSLQLSELVSSRRFTSAANAVC